MSEKDKQKTEKSSSPDTSPTSNGSADTEAGLLLDENASINSLEKIYEVFAASAKRWEAIVYPSMIAFIILAVYGFYLIFSLTTDMGNAVVEMKQMSANMQVMSRDVTSMSNSVLKMSDTITSMEHSFTKQLEKMDMLNAGIVEMNKSLRIMTYAMNQMRRDMSILNNNVSRPMNFMNSFMPW